MKPIWVLLLILVVFAGVAAADPIDGSAATPGATVGIQWIGNDSSISFGPGGLTTFSGIPSYAFGFDLQASGTGGAVDRCNFCSYSYAVDQLNPNGAAQSPAFSDPDFNRWLISFDNQENGAGADRNYRETMVSVDSIKPVPETASIFLFGTGLLAVAGAIRRKLLM